MFLAGSKTFFLKIYTKERSDESERNFFNSYKSIFSRVEGLVQTDALQVLDTIDHMAEEGKDVITIYIIAHGGVDGIRLGGQWFTATQFKNKMAACPDVIFNFILGSCHSGSFIDDLSSLDNLFLDKKIQNV